MDADQRRASIDPEPVSLSLTLFTAVSAGFGVVIQWAERRRGVRQDRDMARTKLLTADRALNRLDEAYRSLISIFEQQGLLDGYIPFLPGHGRLVVDSRLHGEISRNQRAAFDAGRGLEKSLDELGPFLADPEAMRASELAYTVDQSLVDRRFRETMHAEGMREFLIGVGRLLFQLSEFLEAVAADLQMQLPSTRLPLLEETLARLERPPGGPPRP
jgi:hypothetical protein